MNEIKVEAKTVKQAIEMGLKKLNLIREQVEVEILQTERKGVLGIGAKKACVIIREKMNAPDKKAETSNETEKELKINLNDINGFSKSGNPLNDAKNILSQILSLSQINYTIKNEVYDESKNMITINFETDDAGLLLYDNAKGLLSLSQIISIILSNETKNKFTIKLDINDFWNNTEHKIKNDIEHAINMMKRTKKPYRMKPMPSAFRKIVHDLIKEKYPDYSSFSIGHGKDRRVVIKYSPKKKPEQETQNEVPNVQQ